MNPGDRSALADVVSAIAVAPATESLPWLHVADGEELKVEPLRSPTH